MSHYRKITVNSVTYKYNIGKKFIPIINTETNEKKVIPKEEIGFSISEHNTITTPKMIADYILMGKIQEDPAEYFPNCKHTKMKLRVNPFQAEIRVNPFQAEINDKIVYIVACDDCYNNIADDT